MKHLSPGCAKVRVGRTNLRNAQIDDETQIDEKWHRVWEVATHGAKAQNLENIDLSQSILYRVDLAGANLQGANLVDTDLRWANLTNMNLCQADLQSADLNYADLSGANLSYANLHGADLRGANLQSADLVNTILTRARYKNYTQWPTDFDPAAAGAILVED